MSGTVRFDDADPGRSSVEEEIDATSLDTREARRDTHLRSAGIFAAGDVRHGSIKRVASSVGEGAMAVSFVHQYLASR